MINLIIAYVFLSPTYTETPLELISTSNFLCKGGKALCEQSNLSHVRHDTPIGISVDLSLMFKFSEYINSFAYFASHPNPMDKIPLPHLLSR